MKVNQDLIGKTISGVVSVTEPGHKLREIWMLQLSDGTHVEFVSPSGKRWLKRSAGKQKTMLNRSSNELQLSLNVA